MNDAVTSWPLVVDHAFQRCLADTLGETAMDLALDDHQLIGRPKSSAATS
jgi:hypothetical protein